MPHLRFRGVQIKEVQALSAELTPLLAEAIQTDEDNFTFELINTDFFVFGKPTSGSPFVEVLWFKRSDETKKKCAQIITKHLRDFYPGADIAVVFIPLEKSDYFENGEHF